MHKNKIKKQFVKLKPNKDWSFDTLNQTETNFYTHGYHRYPAKFIPQIVNKLILKYTKENDLICDPFGGCGTTIVQSKLLGRRGVSFDINPVATMITEVKTTPINPNILDKEAQRIEKELNKPTKINLKKKIHPRIKYWFDNKSLKELYNIYNIIEKTNNKIIRQFFLCAFSNILKNSSRWLMKSIKPTIDKNKIIENPKKSFIRQISSMKKKNKLFFDELKESNRLKTPAKVYRKDSTKKLPLKNNSVDLIITSPPYVTSYEYADLHQLSLLWFGSDRKNFKNWHVYINDYNKFRKEFIGTNHKERKNGYLNSALAEDIISKISRTDKSLAKNVNNYFLDMNLAFGEIYRILKPKKNACIIIGNTSLRGVDVLNAEIAAEMMKNIGFKKIKYIKREIGNKIIAPWRDSETGKFTNKKNPNKKIIYQYEYILIMQKN